LAITFWDSRAKLTGSGSKAIADRCGMRLSSSIVVVPMFAPMSSTRVADMPSPSSTDNAASSFSTS
jgi:hypothetical protein